MTSESSDQSLTRLILVLVWSMNSFWVAIGKKKDYIENNLAFKHLICLKSWDGIKRVSIKWRHKINCVKEQCCCNAKLEKWPKAIERQTVLCFLPALWSKKHKNEVGS